MATNSEKHTSGLQQPDVEAVLRDLAAIRRDVVAAADRASATIAALHPAHRESARNLLHYLALRRRDLRPLQRRLAALGISSLGRAESHVLATLDAALRALCELARQPWPFPEDESAPALDFESGERLLVEHTDALLGAAAPGRSVRIMVTMPSEAAENYTVVHDLLERGMDCMRINCARDEPAAWLRMIDYLRRAEQALGRPCRIVMDLCGPKLRTGPLESIPAAVRIRPQRDPFGRPVAPARVWLTPEACPSDPPSPADAILPVPAVWLYRLRPGERVRFVDARNSKRALTVVDATDDGCWAESVKTSYVVAGTELSRAGEVGDEPRTARVGVLPQRENAILLKQGDILIVTRNLRPGRPATLDSARNVLTPAMVGCTLPEVFDHVHPAESIWFDDGRIGGVIERVEAERVLVRITQTRPGGQKLRGDKGINLPDSRLHLAALTDKDSEDLRLVAEHADVVELSFASSARDVDALREHLERLGGRRPAVVVKIETRRGFENLPAMLLAAMRMPCCGVMIARGDLAVECGFERLAEVQEEVLWICEAAHVPVIWATQVLESLAKEGIPSRAEITDAAMGHRAECVMLNKGPYVVTAVQVLDDILRRMQAHQAKKRSMLRELRLAHSFPQSVG